MDSSGKRPGSVVAAAVMLSVVAAIGIGLAVWAVYETVTATGMQTLGWPFAILHGAVALTGGVGCAVLIPRVLRGGHRDAATAFTALVLMVTVPFAGQALWILFTSLTSGQWWLPLMALLYALPSAIAVVTIVLLRMPRPSLRREDAD